MSIIVILAFIAMMCAAIYLTAIYALPILVGLAAYSLLNQTDAATSTIAFVSIASGLAALYAARAGAIARNGIVRAVTLALIAATAGYAGYSTTMQFSELVGAPAASWSGPSLLAAAAVAAHAVAKIVQRCPGVYDRPNGIGSTAQCRVQVPDRP